MSQLYSHQNSCERLAGVSRRVCRGGRGRRGEELSHKFLLGICTLYFLLVRLDFFDLRLRIFEALVLLRGMRGTFPPEGMRRKGRVRPEVSDVLAFAARMGLAADAQQGVVLRSTARRGILNCSRQWGKSTVAAAKAVHRAYMRAGCTVLVASPSSRQSAEFLRKASALVRRLGVRVRGDGDNALSLLFPNGSRIVGLPGTEATVRGFSAVSMILIDEAARVSDEMYQSLRPMLAVGDGDLWLMSTPCGQRGFFYETWRGTDPDWLRVSVRATECPRIRAEFLAEERMAQTADFFAQEYLCEFTGRDDAVFDRALILAAIDYSIPPLKIRNRSGRAGRRT